MDVNTILKEYVERLSEDDIIYLGIRFKQNLCGDRAEIAKKLSSDIVIDEWLCLARSSKEWYNMVDNVGMSIGKEYDQKLALKKARKEEERQRRPYNKKRYVKRD